MQNWEHKVIRLGEFVGPDLFHKQATHELNQLRAQGWELVNVWTQGTQTLAALRRKAQG